MQNLELLVVPLLPEERTECQLESATSSTALSRRLEGARLRLSAVGCEGLCCEQGSSTGGFGGG
eukprot:400570-Rhodomonas_salina.2